MSQDPNIDIDFLNIKNPETLKKYLFHELLYDVTGVTFMNHEKVIEQLP